MSDLHSTPIAKPSAPQQPPRPIRFSTWGAVQTVISVGIAVATLLTLWTPSNLFNDQMLNDMLYAMQTEKQPAQPSVVPTLKASSRPRIGIVAGHWGNDSGAVCKDGLTEMEVNLRIATLVQQYLTSAGYNVDLLHEKDARLALYEAAALVSIHNDSCDYINDDASGFKVAAAVSTLYPEKALRLTDCMTSRYKEDTKLPFHANSITRDMTEYHAFTEINSNTPAAIIETGFLNLDRQILTGQPEKIARGVADGILCYVRNESVSKKGTTPAP
jgi:N-acetylmuramoyl-L-alanine amidase